MGDSQPGWWRREYDMTDYTRLAAAGLIMLAMIAGCGDSGPDSPTAPTSPETGANTASETDPPGGTSSVAQANNNDKGDDDTPDTTDDEEDTTGGDDTGGGGDDDGDSDGGGGTTRSNHCISNVQIPSSIPALTGDYTVTFTRTSGPGCTLSGTAENYFGTDAPWITYLSGYAPAGAARLTFRAATNTTASVRTGRVWIVDIANNSTPVGRTTVTQRERNARPTVSIACAPAGACNGEEEIYTDQTVTLTASATDPNSHDTLHYAWAMEGHGVLDPTAPASRGRALCGARGRLRRQRGSR